MWVKGDYVFGWGGLHEPSSVCSWMNVPERLPWNRRDGYWLLVGI